MYLYTTIRVQPSVCQCPPAHPCHIWWICRRKWLLSRWIQVTRIYFRDLFIQYFYKDRRANKMQKRITPVPSGLNKAYPSLELLMFLPPSSLRCSVATLWRSQFGPIKKPWASAWFLCSNTCSHCWLTSTAVFELPQDPKSKISVSMLTSSMAQCSRTVQYITLWIR